MSPRPRVARVTIFKHGVAHVERRGPAEDGFELAFRREVMNDVLKSLSVTVARGEATVGAIAFDPPDEPEALLEGRGLAFAPAAALSGLLKALRGRNVVIDDGEQRQQGQVIGIEETPGGYGLPRRALLIRRSEPAHDVRSHVAVIDLALVRSVRLVEEPSRESLDFLVEQGRAATAGESRAVRVTLAGRASEVRVSYVLPAPVWRIAYRILREGGETRLVAVGIVHNPEDEDLADVELTVSTGQPVAFSFDLYHPRRAARAAVEPDLGAGAPPPQFDPARVVLPAAAEGAAPPPVPAAARAAAADDPAPPAKPSSGETAAAPEPAREPFEHTVDARVSLRRGGAAMVPLFDAKLAAQKHRIWRDGGGSAPDLVLAFNNDTGLVLEEGPAVFYDEGAYGGEAMLPYTARGADVRVALARDLAVRCRRASRQQTTTLGVRLGPAAAVEELRCEEHHTLSAESDHGLSVEVVFELPRRAGRALRNEAMCAVPFEETPTHYRFRAKLEPSGKAALFVREAWLETRAVRYDDLPPAQVEAWAAAQKLDPAAAALLTATLKTFDEARELDARRARLEAEQEAARAAQGPLLDRLRGLKETGPEASVRIRYAKELEGAQERVTSREAEVARLREQAEEARKAAVVRLRRVTG